MTALRVAQRPVYECECNRCGFRWEALEEPISCRQCKSKYWNKPRVRARRNSKPGTVKRGRPRKQENR